MSRFIICVGNFLLRILPNGMKSNKDLSIEKKRIEIRKLQRVGLDKTFVRMFEKLLEYVAQI